MEDIKRVEYVVRPFGFVSFENGDNVHYRGSNVDLVMAKHKKYNKISRISKNIKYYETNYKNGTLNCNVMCFRWRKTDKEYDSDKISNEVDGFIREIDNGNYINKSINKKIDIFSNELSKKYNIHLYFIPIENVINEMIEEHTFLESRESFKILLTYWLNPMEEFYEILEKKKLSNINE